MDTFGDFIYSQQWLKPVESALGAVANATLNKWMPFSQKVRDFLHGTWLGHPLHPVATDVPVGAWTAAAVLDSYELATGEKTFAAGSDLAVEIGLVGATVSAVSGLADWNTTYGKPKRIGALHALLNVTAMGFYVASWWQRRNGCRRAGLTAGLTGYALAFASSYLGGHLVYRERIGVNHAPGELPEKFVPVMAESELPEDKMVKGKAGDIPVMLVRHGGRIFVLAEQCCHLGGPLSEGEFDGKTVTCPWHGSVFAVEGGDLINGPATAPQPCFEVRVRNGQIEVRAPQGSVPEPF